MPAHPLPDGRIPVLLSAHEEDLIGQDAAAIGDYLRRAPEASVAAVAETLLRTRRVRRHRAVVRAADAAELAAGLAALAGGDDHRLVARSSETAKPRTAFVFPGQGNQWPSMGADAYRRLAAYRSEADRCSEAFTAAGLPSPLVYLVTGPERAWSQLDVQAAQFTHAVSLAQVWRSCGVLPDITLGHSLGEVAAAYVAGSVGPADAVAVIAARAAVVERLAGPYGMAVLGAGVDEAERLITETTGWLEVSVVNSPSSTVVSGDRDAVARIVTLAERRGLFVREIDVAFPAHTSALEPLRGELAELLPVSGFVDSPVEFIGSAHGDIVLPGTDFTGYWYDNLRNTVRFDRAAAVAAQRGVGTFVEMSAHPSLAYALTDQLDGALVVGSGRRDEPVVEQLSVNIAAAAVANPGYRWVDVVGTVGGPTLPGFPNAPMRAVHLWAGAESPPDEPALTVAVEEWEPGHDPSTGTGCAMAVVALTGAPGAEPLAARLTAAIDGHPRCRLVAPEEAEIAVLIAPDLPDRDVTAAAAEIRGAIGAGLNYTASLGPRCRRAWLITANAECVGPEQRLPAQAALAAMHRSVGFEFPDCTFAHLDLPGRDLGAGDALACVDALLDDGDTEVALRGGASGLRRHVRVLRERAQLASRRRLDARALDQVVITGGGGGIGMRYARHCVERGARRLILLSRNGIDRERLGGLIDGCDVEVYAPACDITDPEMLSAVAAEYAADGASLLIHAAGAAGFAPHCRLAGADLAAMFGAKVIGLARMVEAWPMLQGSRILLCSSVSGVWGGHGHAGYAAANRLLDVLAGQLRANGLDCTSVRWGLWPGAGIAGADEIARVERSGMVAMDPDAAVDAGLRHDAADPLIFAADFERLRMFFESQGAAMPFGTRVRDRGADTAGDETVAGLVRAELAAALRLAGPESVDLNATLTDLGVDSLLALDLRKRLRRGVGRSVPLARLLGGITGIELIDALGPDRPLERLESSRD